MYLHLYRACAHLNEGCCRAGAADDEIYLGALTECRFDARIAIVSLNGEHSMHYYLS